MNVDRIKSVNSVQCCVLFCVKSILSKLVDAYFMKRALASSANTGEVKQRVTKSDRGIILTAVYTRICSQGRVSGYVFRLKINKRYVIFIRDLRVLLDLRSIDIGGAQERGGHFHYI